MPEPHVPLFPNVSSVEEVRDYLSYLVETGCGKYRLEIRERYIALPPQVCAVDHETQVAFLRGIV